jgi:hypothetical protein
MSTRKRKNDEELVALPSDESESEEEYVSSLFAPFFTNPSICKLQLNSMELLPSTKSS